MSEFASAAMLRVMTEGMKALGLGVDPLPGLSGGKASARVALEDKRRTVMWAVAQAGHACLPLLGQGLHVLSDEPTHAALAAARSPEDLLLRWQRLERYIHSSHRVAFSAATSHSVMLRHQPRERHAPPLPEESLVVLGVLAALLEAVGASDVVVTMDSVRVYPKADVARLQALVNRRATDTWTMQWRAFAARAPATVPPALEDTLPHALNLSHWPPLARRAAAQILKDLMAPLSTAEMATTLGLSVRSMQRTLATAGLSHTGLVAQCRVLAASRYLLQSSTPLTEVGFLCGYSDQPHFTRAFGQLVGLTPARYRQAFGKA